MHHRATPDAGEVEIVERNGRGHPDTLCDAITEHACRACADTTRKVLAAHNERAKATQRAGIERHGGRL